MGISISLGRTNGRWHIDDGKNQKDSQNPELSFVPCELAAGSLAVTMVLCWLSQGFGEFGVDFRRDYPWGCCLGLIKAISANLVWIIEVSIFIALVEGKIRVQCLISTATFDAWRCAFSEW